MLGLGGNLDTRQAVAVAYSSVKLLTSANTEHRCQGELRIASLTQHFDSPMNCFQKTQAPFTTSTGWPRTDETGHQTFAGQREDTQKLTQVLVQDVRAEAACLLQLWEAEPIKFMTSAVSETSGVNKIFANPPMSSV